jgi:putative aminopeptidase FrvX
MRLLKRLSEAFGGSGFETEVAAIVTGELRGICRTVSTDTLGNVVAVKPGRGAKKGQRRIMLAAHMDEIGFLVSHIDKNGFLRVAPAGGFDPRTLMAQRVVVLGRGKKKLTGLLNPSGAPIHIQSEEERKRELKVSSFFVDLGLPPGKVRELVDIGDRVIWERPFISMGDCVTGKALDDRVGVYVMIEALRKVTKNRDEIYAVGTVQEEVGLRGATTSAYALDPDVAIALDVTLAVDTPGTDSQDHVTKLGEGVAIKIMDAASISDVALVSEFRTLAEQKKIRHQLEILPRGGTDAGGMQRARGGSRAITLSIPIRYVHSVNECAHRADIEAAIDLLAAYLDR